MAIGMQEQSDRHDQLRYRPDIDGLRALAVSLVIAFHLAPTYLPNGFVGVDIFFVISGYVVTLSTLRSSPEPTLASVFSFWKRRVARIYPALLVVIFATTAISLLLIPPFPKEVYNGFFRTGLAAVVGFGNLYLFRSRADYFTADQSLNPFLHTWSLGIEEQFYLVFSLIFLALPALTAALLPGGERVTIRRIRILLLAFFTLASAAILANASRSSVLATYYLLQFRFWELGIGCLLAIFSLSSNRRYRFRAPYLAYELACLAALATIIFAAAMPLTANLDIIIAAATLACAALIWLNSADKPLHNTVTARALRSRLARSVGLMSYSLYLWHWPVLVCFRLTVGLASFATMVSAIALTFAFAAGSYFLIEKPFRTPRASFWRRTLPMLGTTGAIVACLALGGQLLPGFAYLGSPQKWTSDWLPPPDFSYAGSNKIRRTCNLGGNADVSVAVPSACSVKIVQSDRTAPTILSVGDSVSFADWGMLSYGFERGTFQWSAYSYDGCGINSSDDEMSPSCLRYWSTMPERIQQSLGQGDFVFIAALWSLDNSDHARAFDRLKQLLVATRGVGAKVILQAPLPQFGRDAFLCTDEWFRKKFEDCSVKRQLFETRRSDLMKALALLREESPDLFVWDPIDQLCDGDICRQIRRGKPLFRNSDHLSYWGALSLGQDFKSFFLRISHDEKLARP
jgi:peptidoglycan/LPS O-acetylase OafA/YrhL